MPQVNMLEAKTNLSRLVEAVERGTEMEIIIARSGRPVARLVPLAPAPAPARKGRAFGLLKGVLKAPDDIDAGNAEILAMFDASE